MLPGTRSHGTGFAGLVCIGQLTKKSWDSWPWGSLEQLRRARSRACCGRADGNWTGILMNKVWIRRSALTDIALLPTVILVTITTAPVHHHQ